MARSSVFDPVENFRFLIDVSGFDGTAQFMKVSAPKRNMDEIEYREGDDSPVLQKSAGLAKFDNVTMERGLTSNSDFCDWAIECHDGSKGTAQDPVYRREMTITQLDREGNPFKKWRLFEAWVTEFRPVSDLDATTSEKTIEFVSITYEDFVQESI